MTHAPEGETQKTVCGNSALVCKTEDDLKKVDCPDCLEVMTGVRPRRVDVDD